MYYLKNNLIMFTYYFSGRRLVMSTREHCSISDWNQTKMRPKSNPVLTTLLNRFENRVNEVHLRLRSQFDIVTPESLRAAVEMEIKSGGKRETLIEYITRHPSGINNSVLKQIKAYKHTDFGDISPVWFADFQKHMEKEGYKLNYIGLIISTIQYIMAQSKAEGLHRNDNFKYAKPSEETESVYLTEAELTAIRKVELSPRLDAIRDRLLISAYTGLRYSDNATLTENNIRGNMLWNKNIKTGNQVMVPINSVIRDILNKYPTGLPRAISNTNTNINAKEICRLAGITTKVEYNGEWVEKYKLVCSHTFRRSCITNLILAGIPTQAVMKISGHKTQSSFQKYVKTSVEESALSIANHSYFK